MLMRTDQLFLKHGFSTVFLIALLFVWQCGKKSQSDSDLKSENLPQHEYKLSWQANTETDISHYLLYGWHGKDTLSSPFIDSGNASNYSQYFVKKVSRLPVGTVIKDTVEYVASGDWLQFAIAAVNKAGSVSPIGLSNFIKSEIPDSSSIE